MSDIFNELYIFEMANNHQGSVDHGLAIIRAMGRIAREKQVNAAVKFQYRDLDTFIHPDFKDRDDVPHIPRFLSTRLSPKEFFTLLEAVREEGMRTVVTPFDEASVDQCMDHGVDILKIASCSADDWPLLEKVADTKRPVVCSTGGLSIYDIDNVASFFTHKDVNFALMHCVALYPTPNEMFNMNFLSRMVRRYHYVPVGYSGHDAPDNLDAVKIAVAMGAQILERHVGLPTDKIKLNAYSMNPEETAEWIDAAQVARSMCGPEGMRVQSQKERDSLLSLKRGVFAAGKIRKGDVIEPGDVFFAMPAENGQTTSGQFGQYRAAFKATKDYKKNEPIKEKREPDLLNVVRGIIHDAKGMLYEAGIELGGDFEVELSHHKGIEHFRNTGALIVNVINREYCKKLVVLLPGQKHPNHFHKIKEETFQLLYGDFEIIHNGVKKVLKPGDKLLIQRNDWHSFTTAGGAIVEEISTTHHKGDSYYEDESIAKLDLIKRKTVIDNW